ncbi:MAG: dihydropteroate synthase [Kofleriaceae bacterium]|nr:dihydropteroate synthase [Kofleriaceae bacterium]
MTLRGSTSARHRIEELAPDGWATWRELRLRALTSDPTAFATTLADARTWSDDRWRDVVTPRPDRLLLVAFEGTRPCGMARAERARTGWAADVFSMWVAPEARRCGVARDLLAAIERWAERNQLAWLQLLVHDAQAAARACYVAAGFEPARRTSRGEVLVRRLRPLVMGVVNVTPDSFSDGGRYLAADDAIAHGQQLVAEGADILDIGGEATNPGAKPIDDATEIARVLPVLRGLTGAGAALSIDTTKAEVARTAVAAGATIVNDVSGGRFDSAMVPAVTSLPDVIYIAGHLRGATLAEVFAAEVPTSWTEVRDELATVLARVPDKERDRVWVDPGVGFGKGADPEGNLALLRHAGDLGRALGCPVVVGPSRKRFVRRLLPQAQQTDALALDVASVAACLGAVQWGATVVRAHNVALLRAALAVYTKL